MTSSTLRVVHSTGYRYDGGATSSYNEARMTPLSDSGQTMLYSRLDVVPTAWTHSFTDYWGTAVTSFELHERHERLRVVSTSTVDVHRHADADRSASWDTVRSPRVRSDFAEFLDRGSLVEPPPELEAEVLELAGGAGTPEALVCAVRDLVTGRISYLPGVTGVKTTASEVWAKGAGVCQDLSHLMIGALRTGGVPARYVSGYLMGDSEQGLEVPTTGQSHAWIEWWDGEWRSWDPTNHKPAGDLHVSVARGRDYRDVSPLQGIQAGGGDATLTVSVLVTRVA